MKESLDILEQTGLFAVDAVCLLESHPLEPHRLRARPVRSLKVRRDDRGNLRVPPLSSARPADDGLAVSGQLNIARHGGLRDDALREASS